MKRFNTRGVLALSLMILLIAFGCSDDDGGTTAPPPPGDTDPPTIFSVLARNANQIIVTYDEAVDKRSAEDTDNYTVIKVVSPPATGNDHEAVVAPGDTLSLWTAALISPNNVLLTVDAMSNTAFGIFVENVADVSGNVMTVPDSMAFVGSTGGDTTPPEVLTVTPMGTGVGVGTSMIVQFSEPMDFASVVSGFEFRIAGNPTAVSVNSDLNTYIFTPVKKIANGASCTARVTTVAKDWSGNTLTAEEFWTFSTTTSVDGESPTLVSTVPANGSTNVPASRVIEIRFSEPIDPVSVEGIGEGAQLELFPEVDGYVSFNSSGTTVLFQPDPPLAPNTFYSLLVPDGGVRDLAGNPLSGTTTVQFTTGATLPTGALTGTLSITAGQVTTPQGAIVVATTSSPFSDTDDDVEIRGTDATIGTNGVYAVNTLPDGWYFPFAIMDSNNDGRLDPETGDVIGAYGVDLPQDNEVDSVRITTGGSVANVDFKLFDPSAIAGTVVYGGVAHNDSLPYFQYHVGAFDTTGFDPDNLQNPDFGLDGESISTDPHYALSSFSDNGLDNGTYYLGAFLDVNFNQAYDPSIDPGGFYQQLNGTLLPVTVVDGTDWDDVDIVLGDPTGSTPTVSVWHQLDRAPSKERDSLRRFVSYAARIAEQLNR